MSSNIKITNKKWENEENVVTKHNLKSYDTNCTTILIKIFKKLNQIIIINKNNFIYI